MLSPAFLILAFAASVTSPAPLAMTEGVSSPVSVTAEAAAAPVTGASGGAVGDFGDITGGSSLEDLLRFSLHEEKNVSVQAASKYGQSVRRTPASVLVISRDEIVRHKYRSIPEALQAVPGFFVYNDTLYDFVNVRGMGLPGDFNTRVLLLLNGHTLNVSAGPGGANLHDFHLDIQSVERIEVIRGPGSVVYGTGAFFAVINVITVAPDSESTNYLSAGAGGPDAIGEASLANGGRSGEWWWQFLSRGYADNGIERYFAAYDRAAPGADARATRDGTSREDRDRATGVYGRLGWREFTLSVYGASRTKQEPTAQFETDFPATANYAADHRGFGELTYQKQWETFRLIGRAFGDYGNWQDHLLYDGGIYRDMIEDRKGGTELRGVLQTERHEFLLGVEANRHAVFMPSGDLEPYRLQVADPNRIWFTTASVYAQESWQPVNPLLFVAGGQLNTNNLYDPFLAPRAGIHVFPTETQTIKLLYSTGIRQPTAFERFFADQDFFIANAALTPEFIQTGELSYEFYPVENLRTYLGGFLNRYDDVITAINVPRPIADDPEHTVNQFVNQGSIRSYGTEVHLEARLPGAWTAFGGVTWQRAKDTLTGLTPDASPAWLGNLRAAGPVGETLLLGVDANYVGSRRLTSGVGAANPYWLVNAALSTKRFDSGFQASVRVRNLLDVDYEELVSSDHAPLVTVAQRPLTAVMRVDYHY